MSSKPRVPAPVAKPESRSRSLRTPEYLEDDDVDTYYEEEYTQDRCDAVDLALMRLLLDAIAEQARLEKRSLSRRGKSARIGQFLYVPNYMPLSEEEIAQVGEDFANGLANGASNALSAAASNIRGALTASERKLLEGAEKAGKELNVWYNRRSPAEKAALNVIFAMMVAAGAIHSLTSKASSIAQRLNTYAQKLNLPSIQEHVEKAKRAVGILANGLWAAGAQVWNGAVVAGGYAKNGAQRAAQFVANRR